MQGRIIRGIGGFYDVLLQNSDTIRCKARGRFRNEGLTPMVGDLVEISIPETGFASMDDILPRTNALLRPPVANIDLLVIVLSACVPKPDFLLLDKLLIQAQLNSVDPVICFTKRDTDTQGAFENYSRIYEPAGFPVIGLSAKEDDSFPELTERIAGKTAFLAGPSGVGKSTLINRISSAEMDTGELSQKLGRGRHTTRHVELLPGLSGGWLVDTPGFTSLELEQQITPEELADWYPEFAEAQCRFADCVHISEPGCAVRTAVDSGEIAKARYDSYKTLYKQLKNRKVRY